MPQGAAWSQPLRPWVLSLLTCTIGARMLGLGKAASPKWGSHSSPQNEKGEWESPLGGSEDTSNTTNSVVVSLGVPAPGCRRGKEPYSDSWDLRLSVPRAQLCPAAGKCQLCSYNISFTDAEIRVSSHLYQSRNIFLLWISVSTL